MSDIKKVVIIGRPNVGKSSLFNRLLKENRAVVDKKPYITRDSVSGLLFLKDTSVELIDTAGMISDLDEDDSLLAKAVSKSKEAALFADLIIFICDSKTGLVTEDIQLANFVKKLNKNCILVINKVDNKERALQYIAEFYALGLGEPLPISALHNIGISKLKILINERLLSFEKIDYQDHIKVAIIGRPNVGKSSLLNAILNQDKLLVDAQAGTTRDAIDIPCSINDTKFLFIDTPGIRRKAKLKGEDLEKSCVEHAIKSVKRADVVVLLLDAKEGLVNQDKKIFHIVEKYIKPCIVAINKSDLITNTVSIAEYKNYISRELLPTWQLPILTTSALKNEGIENILRWVKVLYKQSFFRFDTQDINKVIKKITINSKKTSLKIYYGLQTSINPIVLLLFVKDIQTTRQYIKHIKRKIQKGLGLYIPVKTLLREKKHKNSTVEF